MRDGTYLRCLARSGGWEVAVPLRAPGAYSDHSNALCCPITPARQSSRPPAPSPMPSIHPTSHPNVTSKRRYFRPPQGSQCGAFGMVWRWLLVECCSGTRAGRPQASWEALRWTNAPRLAKMLLRYYKVAKSAPACSERRLLCAFHGAWPIRAHPEVM